MNDSLTAAQLREKSPEDLKVLLGDLYKERFTLRMCMAAGEIKTHRFRSIKRMIARIKTCLAEEVRNDARSA